MTNEFKFVWLGVRAGWLLMIISLVLSALPASFLLADNSGASIGYISIEKSSYNTNEEIVLTALRGNILPQTGGITVVLSSSNGGEFRGGTTGGSCSGTFATVGSNANIIGDNGQKAFCYRNTNTGPDTITAVFTQGTSTETATLLLQVVSSEILPDPDPELYVSICQVTDDLDNPFKSLTVAKALILNADSSIRIRDGDIIPPFEGFSGQNWDLAGQAIHANECQPVVVTDPDPVTFCSITLVSDDKNTVVEKANAYAKLVSSLNSRWTAVVNAPSVWIWGDDPVTNPVAETTYTFEKKFGWNGPINNATLTIAADNSYITKINNAMAGFDSTEFNYQNSGVDVLDVTSLITQGNNVLSVAVKNWAMANGTTATNPGGLKYELVVTGTAKNCDIPYEEEPQTATVSMCKLDDQGNELSDWSLMLLGNKVEDLVVPADIATGINTTSTLATTKNYVALATGTWDNNRGPLNIVDAEYSTEDNWLTQMDGFTGYGTAILELAINDAVDPNSNWGYYNGLHRYAQSFTGATGTLNLSIKDTDYSDNTGNLKVSLFEGYSGITGENGCVTFSDVPVGDYEIDEIQKDGWGNVSGLGKITVSNELARQIIVNRPIEIIDPEQPVATIIAHKIVCSNEVELPNWGLGGPNITATTAEDWVNTHQSCSFADNAEFEWAPSSATNPDVGLPATAFYGVAGGVWTKFGPTNASGTATVYIDATDLGGMSYVWMREVLTNEFIPFTYGSNNATNTDAVSAEMYCHTDVLNYDNYDRVDGVKVDTIYHCVAWNYKEVEVPEDPILTCKPEVELITNGSFENEIVIDSSLWQRFASVLGWNIAKVSNNASTTLELHRGWSGNLASVGAQYAELDGDHSTLISQIILTIPGETYTLSWDFAPRQLVTSDQNQLSILVDDSLVAQNGPMVGMGTLAVADWVPGSYNFVASTSLTKISFKNEGPSDSLGTFIDDVSLRCTGIDDEEDEGDGEDNNSTTTPTIVDPTDDGGSSSSGTRIGYRGGRVAGASTSTSPVVTPFGMGGDYPQIGAVLGDQISAMPYGAPNAGRGGATNSTLPFWSLALGFCLLALIRQFGLGYTK